MTKKSLTLEKVQAYLYEHIPITRHFGVNVDLFDGNTIHLSAPLQKNINHRETAFGGSISAVAILSGWILIHLRLMEKNLNCQLVIQKSSLHFKEPVDSDFQSICSIQNESDWDKYLRTLKKHRKARIRLQSTIQVEDRILCTHEGVYVSILRGS